MSFTLHLDCASVTASNLDVMLLHTTIPRLSIGMLISRWEFGLGISGTGEKIKDWYNRKNLVALLPRFLVGAVGAYYASGALAISSSSESEHR